MESTRRIVMFNWMTASGYFAGADGNLDWVVPDEEQAKAAVDGIPLFDSVLFGRRTYELFEKFWNHAGRARQCSNISRHERWLHL